MNQKVNDQSRARLISRIFVTLFILSFVGCQQSLPDASTWTEYQMGNGKFGVKFPKDPKKVTQQQPSAIGPLELEMQQLEIRKTLAYIASFTQVPAGQGYDIDAGLEGAVQGGAKSSKADIESVTDISKNGTKGKETYMSSSENGGTVMRTRVYIAVGKDGPAVYQAIIVAKNKKDLDNEAANAFLDSMRF